MRDGRIDAIENRLLESEWVARCIAHPVVKAFNTIFARSLLEKGAEPGTAGRIALPVAGDSETAKARVMQLVDDLGFDAVDNGGLADSWRQCTGAAAYCRDLDASALRRALAEAEHARIAHYRSSEEERIRRG